MTFTVQLTCGCLIFPPAGSTLEHRLEQIIARGSGVPVRRTCLVHGPQVIRAAVRPTKTTVRGFGGDQ